MPCLVIQVRLAVQLLDVLAWGAATHVPREAKLGGTPADLPGPDSTHTSKSEASQS